MLPISKIFDKINRQQENDEQFLVLSISGGKVKSGIWAFEEGRGKVLSFGSSESWGGDSPEELVVASDTSISSAVANLSAISKKQPNKVILGLPESWIDGNGVKSAQTKILQVICRKLLLKPQGFVDTPEAVAHFFKIKEGDLVSIILVNLEETQISVSLMVQGRFLGNQIVGRSNNLALDLEEGLLRFNYQDNFPPRIVIIDGENLQEARQTLVAYPWISPERQKRISFLQLPRVDFAPDNLEIEAVVLAGSRDIISGKPGGLEKQTEMLPLVEPPPPVEPLPVEEEVLEEDFGFVKEEDVAIEENLPVLPPQEPELIPVLEISRPTPKRFSFLKFSSLFNFLKKIPGLFKPKSFRFNLPRLPNFPKKGIVFFGLGLGVVLFLFIFSYFKLVKAQVSLLVQPLKIEKQIEFTLSDKISTPDVGGKILPVFKMTTDVSGSKTEAVLGRKTVGDKALGEVVVYNGTDAKKTFLKGTGLKGPDGLRFIFNESVTVPARTTDINASPPIDKWGEGKVAVSAREIGTQYNIAANSNLSLESSTGTVSAVIIRNSSDFSGGTSREISSVSKEDQENLKKALLAELQIKAEENLKTLVSGDTLLEGSLSPGNQIDHFDREVGDEADLLTLEKKATFSVSYFKNESLSGIIKQETASLVPEGYSSSPVKEDKKIVAKNKAKNIYEIQLSQEYYPEISLAETASVLRGKLLPQAKKILGGIKNISGWEIQITPEIFSSFSLLPFEGKNIIIVVKAI